MASVRSTWPVALLAIALGAGCGPRGSTERPVDVVVVPPSPAANRGPAPSAIAIDPRPPVPIARGTVPFEWHGCAEERALRSSSADASLLMDVVNATDEPLTLVWLDYQGTRVHYMDLAPGAAYEQQTFVTHPWLVLAANRCVGLFVPMEEGRHRVVLDRPPLRP